MAARTICRLSTAWRISCIAVYNCVSHDSPFLKPFCQFCSTLSTFTSKNLKTRCSSISHGILVSGVGR